MVAELLQKYVWLIQTFIRAGGRGIDLKELSERWERRFGAPYPRRSFNNHREVIESTFGIRIECDRSTSRYFIRYPDDVSDEDATASWLINTFTVNSILSLGKERLSGRVSVDDVPSGHKHLADVMDAMLENREIRIGYRKYTGSEVSRYTLRPYAVKEHLRRWYIVAFCIERQQMRVYGMDRITEMESAEGHFRMPPGFDVDALFVTSFGIYLSSGKPEEVIFRTSGKEARYISDLPLHRSQKIISREGDSVTFSIFACPDESLLMELFRLSPRIEVLSPESIRREIARRAAETSEIYSDLSAEGGTDENETEKLK